MIIFFIVAIAMILAFLHNLWRDKKLREWEQRIRDKYDN